MLLFLILVQSLHSIGPARSATDNGLLKTALDGSPLSIVNSHWGAPHCRNDLVGNPDPSKSRQPAAGIEWLNQWLDIGADYSSQTFRHLGPIGGFQYSDWAGLWNALAIQDTLDHRIVGFDAKLAGLLNVDSVNGGFQVCSSVKLLPCGKGLYGPSHRSGSLLTIQLHLNSPLEHARHVNACVKRRTSLYERSFSCFHGHAAKLQLLLIWDGNSNGPLPLANASCKFFCDPAWAYSCDEVWVSRIRMPNAFSMKLVDSELILVGPWVGISDKAPRFCVQHAWSLTVTADFDVSLNSKAFPFDYQQLNMEIYIPSYRNTHLVPLRGILKSYGSFDATPQGNNF